MRIRNSRWPVALFVALLGTAIISVVATRGERAAPDVTDTSSEVPGLPTAFTKDFLMDDAFYTNAEYASADEIQRFFERTVWDRRSWLASEKVPVPDEPSGVRVSEALARAARNHRINPLLLLARLQVEKSLVNSVDRPPASQRQFALGCHRPTAAHPNGLDPSVASLAAQIECAALTLENQLARALSRPTSLGRGVMAMEAKFEIGRDATTMDGVVIRPVNAATSALYAYTPIEGTRDKNGNWLVWNVTRRFAAAIQALR